ncbi:MAG: OmpA family protein, partial [Pseudomonadota bacterium]
ARPPLATTDALAPVALTPAAAFAAEAGDRVFFAPNDAELGPRGRVVLERQAAWLRANPQTLATIVGHAGEDDSTEIRGPLSRARAEQVRQILIRLGVAPGRLAATGFAGQQPFASAVTAAGRALNRRAVTVLTPR